MVRSVKSVVGLTISLAGSLTVSISVVRLTILLAGAFTLLASALLLGLAPKSARSIVQMVIPFFSVQGSPGRMTNKS